MKYLLSWKNRDASHQSERESLAAFQKWTPEGNFLQFLGRIDGEGGFAVIETDNPLDVLRDTSKFTPWLEFTAYPVVDIQEFAQVGGEAIEFREAIS